MDQQNKIRLLKTIIGTNGTCKTTLLRCIALGLCGEADANALMAEAIGRLVAQDEEEAEIRIDLVSPTDAKRTTTIVTTIKSQSIQDVVISQDTKTKFNTSKNESNNELFVVGYGIGVTSEGNETFRPYRIIDSVYTLFNYEAELIPSELTLRRLRDFLSDNRKYKNTLQKIKLALGLEPEVKIELPPGGGLEISGPSIGHNIPLQSWADGYRILFSWILDFYGWAMRANAITQDGNIKGILLVDEHEKHLHPSLQTTVLPRLQELWPELQIIGTTHSPLVTLGANPSDVVVLRHKGSVIEMDDTLPDFTGYSAEDMLQSDQLFDTEVYAPETNKVLSEYRQLASIDSNKLTQRQKARIKELIKMLQAQQILLAEESPTQTEIKRLREDLGL